MIAAAGKREEITVRAGASWPTQGVNCQGEHAQHGEEHTQVKDHGGGHVLVQDMPVNGVEERPMSQPQHTRE